MSSDDGEAREIVPPAYESTACPRCGQQWCNCTPLSPSDREVWQDFGDLGATRPSNREWGERLQTWHRNRYDNQRREIILEALHAIIADLQNHTDLDLEQCYGTLCREVDNSRHSLASLGVNFESFQQVLVDTEELANSREAAAAIGLTGSSSSSSSVPTVQLSTAVAEESLVQVLTLQD